MIPFVNSAEFLIRSKDWNFQGISTVNGIKVGKFGAAHKIQDKRDAKHSTSDAVKSESYHRQKTG
jgi:hypothetical protein